METKKWKLIGHSHQIADTGDYDGHYEVTNGKISLLTKDDDDEAIQPIVDALNDSGAIFYQDDFFEFENRAIKQELEQLKEKTTSQQQTIERLRRVLSRNVSILKKVIQRLDEDESVLGKHKNEGILTLGEDMIEEAEQLLNTTEPIDPK